MITKGAFILFVSVYREFLMICITVRIIKNKINYISYTSVTRGAFGNRVSDNVRRAT